MVATWEQELQIVIHRRTPTAGHLTGVLSLNEAIAFTNEELALGRVVILEIGSESTIIRKGIEIIDFIKRVLGVKTEPKPTLTTIAPMAGGEQPTAEMPVPMPSQELVAGDEEDFAQGPRRARRVERRVSPEVEIRAWHALVERIGERAARAMLAGGGYSVRSKLWPTVLYVVTPDIIKVVNQGRQVNQICIVASDGSSIWDVVLSRIQLLESGIDGEVQVFATGRLQER